MKLFKSSIIYLSTAVLCIAIATGCLNSTQSQVTSVVQYYLQVNNFDSTLVSANDTLHVKRFRFVYGDGSVGINDTTAAIYKDPANWQQYSVTQTGQNPIPLFQGGAATYQSFVFSVQQAPQDNVNIDPDFSGNNKQYSYIIEGTYNGDSFTYKSTHTFKIPLSFAPVEVPKNNASVLFLVSTNVQNWFSKSSGGFYDPGAAENDSTINSKIKGSFTIETQSNLQ